MTIRLLSRQCLLALAILVQSIPLPANAATIALIGTEELILQSELVFEGTVISSRTELNQFGRIYTFLEFQVHDVLIGEFDPSNTLELRFTGGNALGSQLDLGVRFPEIDEHGIYFVEKIAPGLINPLLGWEQGHFVVNASENVVAANAREVRAVEWTSQRGIAQISAGVANGIETAPNYDESFAFSIGDPTPSMHIDEFKARIRELAN